MKNIVIDEKKCNGCGACIPQCKEGAIKLVNGKAQVAAELCDKAGACIGRCPQGAISFKEENSTEKRGGANAAISQPGSWPVQLRLIAAEAPFLKNAELLIAADCAPCAYADFHRELLRGKVLLIGCPKFDDMELYRHKLEEIMRVNDLRSITYVRMEVPCCAGLGRVIEESIADSKKKIPFDEIIISVKGERK